MRPLWCGGHRWPRGRTDFAKLARGLLSRNFRVAIPATIGSRPFDCAFRELEISDSEIEQTTGSPFVAWHVENVAASFLRLDEETGDAEGYRQVVQPNQGLWVHQAGRRRQGRVRPHLCSRARRTQHAQRKPNG